MTIALSGFKGSGKDEFYNIITELDNNYKKLAFADPIKNHVMNIFNLPNEEAYDVFKRTEFEGVHGRHIVREIGMLMRSYDENQFTNYVNDNLSYNSVITDLRFDNEMFYFDWLSSERPDVYIIKIKRYNSDDEHITEQELPDEYYDYVIENDGTLEEYKEKVTNLFIELKGK